MIITQSTAGALQALYDYFFNLNSFFDNQYSWLDIHSMLKSQSWVHSYWSHSFTGSDGADGLGDYMILCGVRPVRNTNPANVYEYDNFTELFADMYDEILKFKEAIYNAIDIADKNRDMNVRTFLEDYVTNVITEKIHQALILKEKAIELEGKPAKFDKYFEDFLIIGK